MNQPTVIDVRTELALTVKRDSDVDDPTYRRLPPADPNFPDVFVHNDSTAGLPTTWHVACSLDFYDVDPDEALALAAALWAAARQAQILNAPDALSVLRPMVDIDVSAKLTERPVARLALGVGPDGREFASFGRVNHLENETPGFTWGDDGYSFEYVGDFRHIGTEIRDGAKRAILVGVGALAAAG